MVLTLVRLEPISCYKLHDWIASLHLQQPTCRTIKTLTTLNHIYVSHTIWLVGLCHRIGSCCNIRFWIHSNFLHSSHSWVVGRSYKLPCMSNVNGEPIKKSHDMMNTIMKEKNRPTFFWFFKYCFPRMRKVLASAGLQELQELELVPIGNDPSWFKKLTTSRPIPRDERCLWVSLWAGKKAKNHQKKQSAICLKPSHWV
jgi:hypothetical protein